MKLEDEIQQKSFKTPQQKLAVNLLYTTNWLNSRYQVFLKSTGLTIQQYNVLRILRGQHPKPCALKLIKDRMLDRMSDASRIVDKLVAKKLVLRNQCSSDRRSVNLLISAAGLDLLKEMDALDGATEEMFKHLSVNEIVQLNDYLDRLRG